MRVEPRGEDGGVFVVYSLHMAVFSAVINRFLVTFFAVTILHILKCIQ